MDVKAVTGRSPGFTPRTERARGFDLGAGSLESSSCGGDTADRRTRWSPTARYEEDA
jgi:hypothetical protein